MTGRMLLTGVVLLALAGCASPGPGEAASSSSTAPPSGTPSESPSASGTPSTSPSPSPSPETTAAASVITTAGYGDLKLGAAVPDDTSLVSWDADYCVDNGLAQEGDQYAGRWVADTDPDDLVVRTAEGSRGGPITSITAFGTGIESKSGLHVGSTRSEIEELFPDIEPDRVGVSDLYVIADDLGQVVFEVAPELTGDYEGYWPAEQVDTVLWVHTVSNNEEPFAIAGGDSGGNCGA